MDQLDRWCYISLLIKEPPKGKDLEELEEQEIRKPVENVVSKVPGSEYCSIEKVPSLGMNVYEVHCRPQMPPENFDELRETIKNNGKLTYRTEKYGEERM